MGACICSGGKGVDATGHCVYMPCPKGNMGGVVFRNDDAAGAWNASLAKYPVRRRLLRPLTVQARGS